MRMARYDRYFDYRSFETRHGSPLGHKFDRFFSTDGLAVSIKMTRLKVGIVILEVLPIPLVCKQILSHCQTNRGQDPAEMCLIPRCDQGQRHALCTSHATKQPYQKGMGSILLKCEIYPHEPLQSLLNPSTACHCTFKDRSH